ncbi:MAG: carbohydrate kinase family protein [Candidatus Hodarchaeales archaeon]
MPSQEREFLGLGELLIDLIATTSQLDTYKRYFGGSAANVTLNLTKLGHNTAFAGAIGMDEFGKYLLHELAQESVDTSLVQQYKSSHTSIILVNEFIEPPEVIYCKDADFRFQFSNSLIDMIDHVKIVHTTAHALSFSPLRETIIKAVKYAKEKGKIISFDPNYRPNINPNDPDYKDAIFDILKYTDIVKPSIVDAKNLFGEDIEIEGVFKQLNKFNVTKGIILTCGPQGVYYTEDGSDICYSKAKKVPDEEVVGITGAGDAFFAGFLSALLKNKSFSRSIRLGIESAAKKIKYRGASSFRF